VQTCALPILLNMRQLFHYPCHITPANAATCFIGVLIQIGNGIADSNPRYFFLPKRSNAANDDNSESQLFHTREVKVSAIYRSFYYQRLIKFTSIRLQWFKRWHAL